LSEEKVEQDGWTCNLFLFYVIYNVFPAPYIPDFWASENIGFFEYRPERVIFFFLKKKND